MDTPPGNKVKSQFHSHGHGTRREKEAVAERHEEGLCQKYKSWKSCSLVGTREAGRPSTDTVDGPGLGSVPILRSTLSPS